jgi:hypothetical protein
MSNFTPIWAHVLLRNRIDRLCKMRKIYLGDEFVAYNEVE